jgi:hypothetical protein
MNYKLKQDITIPEGTILKSSSARLRAYKNDHDFVVLPVCAHTLGRFEIEIDLVNHPDLCEYFEPI